MPTRSPTSHPAGRASPILPPPPQAHRTPPGTPWRPSGGKPVTPTPPAAIMAPMTRAQNTALWATALIVAAVVLGKKADDPIPWAVGVAGTIVLLGALLAALVERDRGITAAHKAAKGSKTSGTPGASAP